ncbi:DUF3304 domain-containing protein [Serratia quinivorans]|uniref:DUF3304 domain-containing protein n=1 Tax=Serratia quinivorans TaxID=137545 RepID=UPI0034C5EFD0
MKRLIFILVTLLVSGCSRAGNDDYTAGDLRAKNHVAGQNINWFSVNGHRAPGLGGGYCCVMLPLKWTPDLKARIEWEVDPDTASPFPGYQDREKYKKWEKEVKASYQKHSTVIDIPQYGKERCGISVHFLPCNQVKVTTVCEGYGTPTYPIKEPMNMEVPVQCPK